MQSSDTTLLRRTRRTGATTVLLRGGSFVVATTVALFAALVFVGTGLAAEKTNLLLITADDLNGDSMGWMGCKVGATPNLDAFAASCQRFEHFYVTAPICQPSREAFMTGRVPHRSGALGFNPIRSDVPTLPEVLRSSGWFVATINKTAHMRPTEKFPWHLDLGGSGKSPKVMREQFEQCLKAAADAKKPFFVNANITDPHRPFPSNNSAGSGGKKQPDGASAPVKVFSPDEIVIPPILEDLPDIRKEIAQYFSAVRRMDENFAGLLAALKAAGQDANTIIVFFSDNGISAPFSKASLFKSGAWSPMLFRWPGQEKPEFNREDMIGAVDLMPTVLEILGVALPPGMDGRSFVPLLKGQQQPGRDHVFTWVNTVSSGKSFPSRCVRTKTRAYIWNAWPDGKTEYKVEGMSGLTFKTLQQAAAHDPKLRARVDHYLYRCTEEFYDLGKDPAERVNLIHDASYAGEIERMKAMLLAEMKRTGDPLLPQIEKPVRQDSKPSATSGVRCLAPDNASGSCKAAIVEEGAALAHTAQVFPVNRKGRTPPNVTRQTERVLANLDATLKSAGSGLDQAVKLNVYLASNDSMPEVQQVLADQFAGQHKPAVSFVVGELPVKDALVAMDAVAVTSVEARAEKKVGIPAGYASDGIAPVAVLPAGPKVYVSGMADTNSLVPATRKTLEKLVAAIGHLGLQRDDIIQVKVFLQPMSEVAAVRKEVSDFFGGEAPPTVFVEWISSNPPVEIELIAAGKSASASESDSVSFITPPGTTDSKVYKRVTHVNHGKLIYVSGLYGMKSPDGAGQVREIFATLGEVVKQAGSDFEHLVKATYYVVDEDASTKLNDIRPEFYNPQRPPAASKAKVKGVGVPGKTVTMDMIAVTR